MSLLLSSRSGFDGVVWVVVQGRVLKHRPQQRSPAVSVAWTPGATVEDIVVVHRTTDRSEYPKFRIAP